MAIGFFFFLCKNYLRRAGLLRRADDRELDREDDLDDEEWLLLLLLAGLFAVECFAAI